MKVPLLKLARGKNPGLNQFGRRVAHRLFAGALLAATLLIAPVIFAQTNPANAEKAFYDQIRSFSLGGGSATVSGLVLNRDRAQITFTGTFYFATPVAGHVTGAVFVGDGKFSAQVPPSDFEKENVRRLLHADAVESDFRTAVLRFSDDTFEQLGQKPAPSQADANTQKIAKDLEARVLKETGANLSARIASSILNHEKPGFFFASFDGGSAAALHWCLITKRVFRLRTSV